MDNANISDNGGNILARCFSLFIALGSIFMFLAVIILKQQAGQNSYILLGAIIFFINLITILGYTSLVRINDKLLSDSDAPDLAYYLGFILTVCALSSIFIADAFVVSNDITQQSNLIQHALFQFGIGLTATMIGLCARIYLAAAQKYKSNFSDPINGADELYRKLGTAVRTFQRTVEDEEKAFQKSIENGLKAFRDEIINFKTEISGFQKEMTSITGEYTKTVGGCMKKLQVLPQTMDESLQVLCETTKKTTEAVAKCLNYDIINQSIAGFVNALNSFKEVTEGFVETGKLSVASFKSTADSVENLSSQITLMGRGYEKTNQDLSRAHDNATIYSDDLGKLHVELHMFCDAMTSSKTVLESFNRTMQNYVRYLKENDGLGQKIRGWDFASILRYPLFNLSKKIITRSTAQLKSWFKK